VIAIDLDRERAESAQRFGADLFAPRAAVSAGSELKIGCIGAGGFARDTIFPALRENREFYCTPLQPGEEWRRNLLAGCFTSTGRYYPLS
jgi:hypothetical protein